MHIRNRYRKMIIKKANCIETIGTIHKKCVTHI